MAKFHESKSKLTNIFFNFDLKCGHCGLRFVEFDQKGLFGCEHCYESFRENLVAILDRIHGSSKHIGSRPMNRRSQVSTLELAVYKQKLEQAVSSLNFEEAAKFRDIIKDIERQLH